MQLWQGDNDFRFYTGVHNTSWLHTRCVDRAIPLFVSRNRMPLGGKSRTKFKRATTIWALDSGAFTELQRYGTWKMSAEEYAGLVNIYDKNIGMLQWASPQDWMCEPQVLSGLVRKKRKNERLLIDAWKWRQWAESLLPDQFRIIESTYNQLLEIGLEDACIVFHGTGLTLQEHQIRTVENFVRLRSICKVKLIPVIQGYTKQEYFNCIRMYLDAGVDLRKEETVGIGSVCRREATTEIADLITSICQYGISLHAFGVKTGGLKMCIDQLASADSMAWSLHAKHHYTTRKGTCCGKLKTRGKEKGKPIKNCANCYHAAVEYHDRIMGIAT